MVRLRRNPYIYLSGAFGAIWVMMAWSWPENSYFMFPVLAAAAVPISYRLMAGHTLPLGISIGAAVAGLLNVILLSAILTIAGKLEGPTMLQAGGAMLDAILLGLMGAVAGTLLASINLLRR